MRRKVAHSGEHLTQIGKLLVGLIWEMLMGKVKAGGIRLLMKVKGCSYHQLFERGL